MKLISKYLFALIMVVCLQTTNFGFKNQAQAADTEALHSLDTHSWIYLTIVAVSFSQNSDFSNFLSRMLYFNNEDTNEITQTTNILRERYTPDLFQERFNDLRAHLESLENREDRENNEALIQDLLFNFAIFREYHNSALEQATTLEDLLFSKNHQLNDENSENSQNSNFEEEERAEDGPLVPVFRTFPSRFPLLPSSSSSSSSSMRTRSDPPQTTPRLIESLGEGSVAQSLSQDPDDQTVTLFTLRILIADDESSQSKMLNTVLSRRLKLLLGGNVRIETEIVENGAQLVESLIRNLLEGNPFDLVITDREMDNTFVDSISSTEHGGGIYLNGDSAVALSRVIFDSLGRSQPIIISRTGCASEEQKSQFMNAGLDAFMPKNIDVDLLKNNAILALQKKYPGEDGYKTPKPKKKAPKGKGKKKKEGGKGKEKEDQ